MAAPLIMMAAKTLAMKYAKQKAIEFAAKKGTEAVSKIAKGTSDKVNDIMKDSTMLIDKARKKNIDVSNTMKDNGFSSKAYKVIVDFLNSLQQKDTLRKEDLPNFSKMQEMHRERIKKDIHKDLQVQKKTIQSDKNEPKEAQQVDFLPNEELNNKENGQNVKIKKRRDVDYSSNTPDMNNTRKMK